MSEFLEYLKNLPAEGETLLLTLQKPVKKDGQFQFHKNGQMKCVWPAMLPDTFRPGRPFYANTASFIVERLDLKHPSASASNCEYVLVLILDDIGSKSKTPPLEPTWKMETSPGNQQWGYAFLFDAQPTKADFSAAIIAIAEAGYTDPGAINPVRNFRLEGSINIKPGRDNFASRLVEFHPERQFSLPQICTALGVVPGESSTSQHRAVKLLEDGSDEVLQWLSESGQLLERAPNGAGWVGVTCPNASEHTDGNPEGRYNPVSRAYCCMHSHCGEWDSARYLSWVAEQGGPEVESGVRSDLLTNAMRSALTKIENQKSNSQFNPAGDAAAVAAEITFAEHGRVEKAEWWRTFAYVLDDEAFFNLDTRVMVSRANFDSLYRHILCHSIHKNKDGKAPKISASVCYDEGRARHDAIVLQGTIYAPGEGAIVEFDGARYGNRWSDRRVTPSGNTDMGELWKHILKIVPNDEERAHLLDVMAYKYQNPKGKVNHAILLAGTHGAGKDTLVAAYLRVIGGESEQNVYQISAKDASSQFTYHGESEVVAINELRPSEFKDRRALENELKTLIAAPPHYIHINRKGEHPYRAVNRVLVLASSNFRDAIALSSDDRRWFVLWTNAPKNEVEIKRVWAWLENGGYENFASFLAARDVSHFNPKADPPMTEAKQIMLEQARSPSEEYLINAIQGWEGPFAHGVFTGPINRAIEQLQLAAPGSIRVTASALYHALGEAGWIDLGRVASREHVTAKRIFAAPRIAADYTKSDIRRLVEAEKTAPVPLRAVK